MARCLVLLAWAVAASAQPPLSRDPAELLDRFARATNFDRQLEVAEQLAATGDTRVLADLEPWLKHEDRHLRGNAAFVFAKLGDPRGFEAITATLDDRAPRPLGQGIPGGSFNPAAPGWWQVSQVKADRYYAVHLLGTLRDPRVLDELVALLSDPDIAYKAAWALAEIGDRRAIPALTGALSSSDPMTRISAIESLDRLKATDALPGLRALLGDTAYGGKLITVGQKARAAIASIGDSALRLGDVAVALSETEIQHVVQVSGCGAATPWLIIGTRVHPDAGAHFVEVFCAADVISSRVRRGALVWLTRRTQEGSTWGPWSVQSGPRYAQVLRTGDRFSDIAGLEDPKRPIRIHGTMPDEELGHLVTFLRDRAATRGAGPRERLEEWPLTTVTRNPDGTVTAVLSSTRFEAQRIVLRRTADRWDGWEIVSINYVVA